MFSLALRGVDARFVDNDASQWVHILQCCSIDLDVARPLKVTKNSGHATPLPALGQSSLVVAHCAGPEHTAQLCDVL